jgi:hypothetical protein
MTRSLLVSLVAFACSAVAQVKTFPIGAVREDVFKQVGTPEKFWAPEPSKYLHGLTEYKAALGIWARIDDVYTRETPKNLYEIRASYHFDTRESRLRPKERLTSLEILVDKPGTYREMLADFPEAKDICASGCKLYGITDFGDRYYVLAYPTSPTAEQLETGLLAATGYKPEGKHDEWCMAIKLKLEQRGSILNPQPPDWNGKIGEIELCPTSLPFELKRGTSLSRNSPAAELGTWQPEK